MGNKLDLDEIDYLRYLIRDPKTEIIGLYLESIERGRELMEIARTTSKPILLHKSNIGEGSRQIAKLHTAALANDDRIVETALKQPNIIRTRDFRSFVNAVKAFSLPAMRGDRLVVISRSGGIGHHCGGFGRDPRFSPLTRSRKIFRNRSTATSGPR